MRLFFAGAEIPEYQDRLAEAGVVHRAVSFKRVDERPGEPTIREGARYWVDHGMSGQEIPDDVFDGYLTRYLTWLTEHLDVIDGALEFDSATPAQRARARDLMMDALGQERVWRVWSIDQGIDELRMITALEPPGLVVVGKEIHKDAQVMALLSAQRAGGLPIHIHMAPNPERIARIRPDTVSTMSWNAPLRFGELITPRGAGIQRFQPPHDNRVYAIAAERAEALGLSPDKIKGGDPDEAVRLAIATLLRFETQSVGQSEESGTEVDPETGSGVVGHMGSSMRKPDPADQAPTTRTLPGIGFGLQRHEETDENGLVEVRDLPVLQSGSESHRKCDTCFLSASCPAYIPGNACAFHLPVELRTKTQVKALVDTMLEIQTARVAFGRFAEEINGGYPDPVVGKEMDRLMKMVETKTEMEQSKESLTLSVEAKSAGGPGILSALFGARAERLDDLPNGGYDAQQTNVIMGEIASTMDDEK